MPYVGRDENGRIILVSATPRPDASEPLSADAADLWACLFDSPPMGDDPLARSDQDLIRVVEDIIDMLIDRNLIRFTDLPEAAQQKLVLRRSLRKNLGTLDLLGASGDGNNPIIGL